MIRLITNQQVLTLAGSGNTSTIPTVGLGTVATLSEISSIAISKNGTQFYVLLYGGYVREMSCSVGYNFNYGSCIAFSTPNPTFSPTISPGINYVNNIIVKSFIGTGISGSMDGIASVVQLMSPLGMCMDNSGKYLYIPSFTAGTIRKTDISDGFTITLGNLLLLIFCLFVKSLDYYSWKLFFSRILCC